MSQRCWTGMNSQKCVPAEGKTFGSLFSWHVCRTSCSDHVRWKQPDTCKREIPTDSAKQDTTEKTYCCTQWSGVSRFVAVLLGGPNLYGTGSSDATHVSVNSVWLQTFLSVTLSWISNGQDSSSFIWGLVKITFCLEERLVGHCQDLRNGRAMLLHVSLWLPKDLPSCIVFKSI